MPTTIDAVVPAFNESATIAHVVTTLIQSGVFRRVTVVDDGSSDATSAEAQRAGATALRMPQNSGKGQAMFAGVRASDAPFIAFFDADLVGLTPEHVRLMAAPINEGRAAMSVGLRDYGIVYNKLQPSLPLITGERIVARAILERVPPEFWRGWKIEAAINEAVRRAQAPVSMQVLHGIQTRPKWMKVGLKNGIVDGVKMLFDVLVAMRDAQGHV